MNRSRLPLWSLIPGLLFIVSLVLTLLSVAFYGLDTPRSHALAGAAALFFVVFIISENYHPVPLLPRSLRASQPLQISLWTGIFSAAVTYAAGFLLAVAMYQVYSVNVPGIILSFVPWLLMRLAGTALGEKLGQGISSTAVLLWGFMLAAGGLGLISVMPAHTPFWLALLPGILLSSFGTGLVRHAACAGRDALTGDEYHYALRLGVLVQVSSTAVILALLTLLLRNNPGHQGFESGFSLLGALALAGVVTALMAPVKGKKVTIRQSDNGKYHRQG
jgi:hypothetical protein